MASRFDSVVNVGTLVVGVTILAIAAQARFHRTTSGARSDSIDQVNGLNTLVTDEDKRQGEGRLIIIEFSDFQCPFCGTYARETYAKLRRAFVDTGHVQYVFRHFPLEAAHPLALKAAEASECAFQQGHFWQMHDALFASHAGLGERELSRYAHDIGLQDDLFAACLEKGMATRVRQDAADGRRLGVTATPTFLIGYLREDDKTVDILRRLRGAKPFELFQAELEKLLTERNRSAYRREATKNAADGGALRK